MIGVPGGEFRHHESRRRPALGIKRLLAFGRAERLDDLERDRLGIELSLHGLHGRSEGRVEQVELPARTQLINR